MAENTKQNETANRNKKQQCPPKHRALNGEDYFNKSYQETFSELIWSKPTKINEVAVQINLVPRGFYLFDIKTVAKHLLFFATVFISKSQ